MISRTVFLPLILLLAATGLAQADDSKGKVLLTIEPAVIAVNAGQAQKFTAHIEGAPAATVITWAIPNSERDVCEISPDAVFKARIVEVYRVFAVATVGRTVIKTAMAKATVIGQYYEVPAR